MVTWLANTAFGGSLEGLMMAILHERELSKEEAARIRELIQKAEERK